MTDTLLVIKSVQLTVHGFEDFKTERMVKMLTKLSGLNVYRGGLSGNKLYAYFDNADSANLAAFTAIRITCCITRVHKGTFDVTSLVRGDHTSLPKDLSRQVHAPKTRSAKESKFIVNAIKRSTIERSYKDVKSLMMIFIHHIQGNDHFSY